MPARLPGEESGIRHGIPGNDRSAESSRSEVELRGVDALAGAFGRSVGAEENLESGGSGHDGKAEGGEEKGERQAFHCSGNSGGNRDKFRGSGFSVFSVPS